MKNSTQNRSARSRALSIANVAAAFAVATLTLWMLWYASVIWNPGQYGDFGLSVGGQALEADNGSWVVSSLVPGYPAEKAGIKLGDRVDAALPVRDRLALTGQLASRPGESVTLRIQHGGERRTLTLMARPLAPLSTTGSVVLALQVIASIVFVVVGLVLVLLCPSRMTWGFYLFAFPLASGILPISSLYPISFLPTSWLLVVDIVEDVLTAAGLVGFLVFCLRFPANAPTGWRRSIDNLTPFLGVAFAVIFLSWDLGVWLFLWPAAVTRGLWNAWLGSIGALLISGSAVLLTTYFTTSGPVRYKIKWVILGLICTCTALLAILLSWGGPLTGLPRLCVGALGGLVVTFPLTVAYAVIRHRVIDVRFVVSRSMTLGAVAAIVGLIVIGIDWLFSTKLPTSRFQTATYFGAALLIGLSLNAMRHRIGKLVDFLFFRQWHRSQQQADSVADALRGATSKTDLYGPLTSGIGRALSLASAALFERIEGGGFVRVAAHGWPAGTLWNLFFDDPLVARADMRPGAADIDASQWQERGIPPGVARPAVMLPIVAGKHVAAILLFGAHCDGSSLDPDELRIIRGLAADVGLVYANSATESERSALFGQRLAGAPV